MLVRPLALKMITRRFIKKDHVYKNPTINADSFDKRRFNELLHMSKGLQYDVVFVMGLCEGVFPDYRAINEGEKQLAQEKNNMYVAVTRAKRLCYMTFPKKKMMPWGDIKYQTPSRYIKDIL